MFDQLKYQYTLSRSRRQVRRQSPREMTDFTKAISSASSYMVVLPHDDAEPALGFVSLLKYSPQVVKLLVIVPDLKTQLDHTISVLEMNELNFKRKHVPNEELIRRVQSEQFSVAIDMNTSFYLPAAYLVAMSNAGIKAGFPSDEVDFFYNFIFQVGADADPQTRFQQLSNYLLQPSLL